MYESNDAERRINWSAVLAGMIVIALVTTVIQLVEAGANGFKFQRGEMELGAMPIFNWPRLAVAAVGTAFCLPRPEFGRRWLGLRVCVTVLAIGSAALLVVKRFETGGYMVLPDSWITSQAWWLRLFVDRSFIPYVTLHALLALRTVQILYMKQSVYKNMVLPDVFMLMAAAGLYLAIIKWAWTE